MTIFSADARRRALQMLAEDPDADPGSVSVQSGTPTILSREPNPGVSVEVGTPTIISRNGVPVQSTDGAGGPSSPLGMLADASKGAAIPKPDDVKVSSDPELTAYLDRLTAAQKGDAQERQYDDMATVGYNLAHAGLGKQKELAKAPSESDQARAIIAELEALQAKRAARAEASKRAQLDQDKFAEEKRHNIATETQKEKGGGMSPELAYRMGRDRFEDERHDREKAQAGTVAGLERDPGTGPGNPEDAKKVKASMVSAEKMGRYVNELRQLHHDNGTELVGATSVRMAQLMKQIQIEAKNIAELGALSGPDYKLMEELSGSDPTSLTAKLKSMFGVDNTETALDGLMQWVNETVGANKKVYGYHDTAEKPSGAPTGPTSGRIRVSNGKETLEIDAADLAHAQQDGYRRI